MSRIATVPVRWSWLSRFSASPAHALHAATAGFEATAAMRLGTAAHAAALEPHRLVVFGGKVKRGKEWDSFMSSQSPDAVIVNARELEIATGIATALLRADEERVDPTTGEPLPLLYGPGVVREQNIRWTRRGRSCSSTPDARLPGRWVTDLKTARSGHPDKFVRAATWAGYLGQLAFYQEADGGSARLFTVVVEPFPPYVVTTYELDEHAIESGRRLVDQCWSQLVESEHGDHWPGYAQSVVKFSVATEDLIGDFIPDGEADRPTAPDDNSTNRSEWSDAL